MPCREVEVDSGSKKSISGGGWEVETNSPNESLLSFFKCFPFSFSLMGESGIKGDCIVERERLTCAWNVCNLHLTQNINKQDHQWDST